MKTSRDLNHKSQRRGNSGSSESYLNVSPVAGSSGRRKSRRDDAMAAKLSNETEMLHLTVLELKV
jgi:hypothetical protein